MSRAAMTPLTTTSRVQPAASAKAGAAPIRSKTKLRRQPSQAAHPASGTCASKSRVEPGNDAASTNARASGAVNSSIGVLSRGGTKVPPDLFRSLPGTGGDLTEGLIASSVEASTACTMERTDAGARRQAPEGASTIGADEASASAVHSALAEQTAPDLVRLQRQRQFCIVSQQRIDRACESYLARELGYRGDLPEAERKAIFATAFELRREVEAAGRSQMEGADRSPPAPAPCIPIVLNSADARACWDTLRANTEREMQRHAKGLPVWTWAASVKGLSAQGLACIIGETGDLSNYETKERVWKRLGLAVIDGIAQQRRSKMEEAAAHGFSPKRRATVWAIADVLLQAQWRGERDGKPAHPIGPYGAVYGRRKAHTVNREGWTPKHRDNDARRVMSKALIEDLWRVWNGKEPLAAM